MKNRDQESVLIKHYTNIRQLSQRQLEAIRLGNMEGVSELLAQKQLIVDQVQKDQAGLDMATLPNEELEKLRQNDSLEVVFEVQEQFEGQPGIAPFILMTFMENAFKHVSRHHEAPNWIRGDLQFDRTRLIFNLCNSISEEANTEVVHYGGIGLKNVRRRLDLIYPEKYKLDTWRDTDRFVVHFEVELETLVMTEMSQMSLNQVG